MNTAKDLELKAKEARQENTLIVPNETQLEINFCSNFIVSMIFYV